MKPERFPDCWDLVQAEVQVEEVVLEHFGFLLCVVQEGKSHLGGGLKMGHAGGELTPGRSAEAKNRAARGAGLWPAIGFDGSVYRIGGIGRRLGPACSLFGVTGWAGRLPTSVGLLSKVLYGLRSFGVVIHGVDLLGSPVDQGPLWSGWLGVQTP